MPLVDPVERGCLAVDELVEIMGRAAIGAVLVLSAQGAAGPRHGGKATGGMRRHSRQASRVCMSDRKLRVARPRPRHKGKGRGKERGCVGGTHRSRQGKLSTKTATPPSSLLQENCPSLSCEGAGTEGRANPSFELAYLGLWICHASVHIFLPVFLNRLSLAIAVRMEASGFFALKAFPPAMIRPAISLR